MVNSVQNLSAGPGRLKDRWSDKVFVKQSVPFIISIVTVFYLSLIACLYHVYKIIQKIFHVLKSEKGFIFVLKRGSYLKSIVEKSVCNHHYYIVFPVT